MYARTSRDFDCATIEGAPAPRQSNDAATTAVSRRLQLRVREKESEVISEDLDARTMRKRISARNKGELPEHEATPRAAARANQQM